LAHGQRENHVAGQRRTLGGSDQARSSGEAATLRVLTLNAHQGVGGRHRRGLLAGIRSALRASAADLVFLQEVGGDIGAEDDQEHCEMLADEVWPQFAYGRNAVAGDGHQGNGVLSKYPIARWQNLDVSVDRAERRGMLHCVIDVPHPRGPLHAVCVHLGLREAHRQRQVERLVEFITHQVPADAPLIAAGDFNDWRARSHRRLAGIPGIEEICTGELGAPARTFPAWCPVLRLDRIYVRNIAHRRLALPSSSWSGLSDHVPLAGEVSL
jgi:endonuclease/exonuclease/phosphatase family metal-dependent hydrolase